jgi:hypothetical protein
LLVPLCYRAEELNLGFMPILLYGLETEVLPYRIQEVTVPGVQRRGVTVSVIIGRGKRSLRVGRL